MGIVLECTGLFNYHDKAAAHLAASTRKVSVGSPAKRHDATIVLGVNTEDYDGPAHTILSCGSAPSTASPLVLTLRLADGSPSTPLDGHRGACSVGIQEGDGHRGRARLGSRRAMAIPEACAGGRLVMAIIA
ncbi:hypothetical protein [Sorangium sp. So ce1153]|uniref:hypothetical protein n=1 Tax=Sorangium sp. So ce1153 TaxID=3133333 RepID=UPI003F6017A0